jgi:hypothetical protein
MQALRKQFLLTLSLLALGCSGLEVSQDYDVNTDFSGLKSFTWKSEDQKKTGDVRVDNPLLDRRIRAAVERSLTAKGFRKGSSGEVDFTVSYVYQIRRKVGSDRVRTSVGFGTGSGGGFGGVGVSTGGGVSEYDEGMLVIDITATDSDSLLWRGTGTRQLSRRSNPEQVTAEVEETVDRILVQFPPQPK